MKILIIGGGIGGVATAGFLERKGFDVTLIERAPEFKNIGFSMSVFGNGRRLLRELGIDDEVVKKGYTPPWTEFADLKGHPLTPKLIMKDFAVHSSESVIGIERATLHENLVSSLKMTKVILGTTVKKLENLKDKVHVVLSDGSSHTFDLLVAADGIRSQVREDIFGKGQSSFYNWSLRFFWLPAHVPAPKGVILLSKDKATLAFYPTLNRCCIGIYEYNPKRVDHPPVPLGAFLPYLKRHGWTEKHIKDLEKEAEEGHQFYDHLRHVSIGPWYKKRVVLLGDSRHGLSPVTGMSGAMAMEDGFVLADELAKVDVKNIPLALENYSKRRTKRVEEVMKLSRFLEKFYFVRSRFQRFVRDIAVKFVSKDLVPKKYKRIIYGRL